jgi:hypothetical protein
MYYNPRPRASDAQRDARDGSRHRGACVIDCGIRQAFWMAMMRGHVQRWFLRITFAFNILALFAGIMGFLNIFGQSARPTGATVLFSLVLIATPVLNIVVIAKSPWAKAN